MTLQQEDTPKTLETAQRPSKDNHKSIAQYNIRFHTARVIMALLFREMLTTYGRSTIGYFWAVLEPVGIIIILTFAFSFVFREPPLGSSFMLFYATGYLPFNIYNTCQSKIASSISGNKNLLFYPVVKYVDVILARIILISLTEFTVALVIFFGVIMTSDTGARPDIIQIFISLNLVVMLGSSIGLMNATLFEIMPSFRSIWRIISRPIFFISGVFFLFESLDQPVQDILWWNPLVHIISLMRQGMYPEYEGTHISILYVVSVSMIIASIGLVNLRTSSKFIMNN